MLLTFLLINQVLGQYGQNDLNYTNFYNPDVVSTSNTSTSNESVSNIQKYIPDVEAEKCVGSYCQEEQVACNFEDNCIDIFGRFNVCLNATRSFKDCRSTFQNTSIFNVTFELTDLLECYELCGYLKLKGLGSLILLGQIGLILIM